MRAAVLYERKTPLTRRGANMVGEESEFPVQRLKI